MSRIRRNFSPTFKADVALHALRGDKSQAALCREHNISPDLICRWKQTLEEQATEIFTAASRTEDGEARLAELERLVGQLTVELCAAKKLSSILPFRSQKNGR